LKDTTPVTIDDAHAIKKSFPDFFARLRRLGVSVVVN